MRARNRGAVVLAALVLVPLAISAVAQAQGSSVTSARTVTTTVDSGTHDKFAVTPPSGGTISVKFTITSGGNVDIWILSSSELSNYENPSVPSWYATDNELNTHSWSGVVSKGGLMYFVVDNEATSQEGAKPTGPVSYTAEFVSGDLTTANVPFIIAGVVAALIVVGLVRRRVRARRQAAAIPPPFPPGTEHLYQPQQPPQFAYGGQTQSPYAPYPPQPPAYPPPPPARPPYSPPPR